MRIRGTRHLARGLDGQTLTLGPTLGPRATQGIDVQVLTVSVLK